MGELSLLPNIGAVLEEQLSAVGIQSAAELCTIGSREVWLRIQKIDSSACINRLLALEGAARGIKKEELPAEIKAELREFCRIHRL